MASGTKGLSRSRTGPENLRISPASEQQMQMNDHNSRNAAAASRFIYPEDEDEPNNQINDLTYNVERIKLTKSKKSKNTRNDPTKAYLRKMGAISRRIESPPTFNLKNGEARFLTNFLKATKGRNPQIVDRMEPEYLDTKIYEKISKYDSSANKEQGQINGVRWTETGYLITDRIAAAPINRLIIEFGNFRAQQEYEKTAKNDTKKEENRWYVTFRNPFIQTIKCEADVTEFIATTAAALLEDGTVHPILTMKPSDYSASYSIATTYKAATKNSKTNPFIPQKRAQTLKLTIPYNSEFAKNTNFEQFQAQWTNPKINGIKVSLEITNSETARSKFQLDISNMPENAHRVQTAAEIVGSFSRSIHNRLLLLYYENLLKANLDPTKASFTAAAEHLRERISVKKGFIDKKAWNHEFSDDMKAEWDRDRTSILKKLNECKSEEPDFSDPTNIDRLSSQMETELLTQIKPSKIQFVKLQQKWNPDLRLAVPEWIPLKLVQVTLESLVPNHNFIRRMIPIYRSSDSPQPDDKKRVSFRLYIEGASEAVIRSIKTAYTKHGVHEVLECEENPMMDFLRQIPTCSYCGAWDHRRSDCASYRRDRAAATKLVIEDSRNKKEPEEIREKRIRAIRVRQCGKCRGNHSGNCSSIKPTCGICSSHTHWTPRGDNPNCLGLQTLSAAISNGLWCWQNRINFSRMTTEQHICYDKEKNTTFGAKVPRNFKSRISNISDKKENDENEDNHGIIGDPADPNKNNKEVTIEQMDTDDIDLNPERPRSQKLRPPKPKPKTKVNLSSLKAKGAHIIMPQSTASKSKHLKSKLKGPHAHK